MKPGAVLLWGLALGCGLGLLYGFLRPLRRRRNWPADLVFMLACLVCWIWFSFGICAGDIRLLPTATLALGALLWEATVGRRLQGLFRGFWCGIFSFFRSLTFPAKKFFQKIHIFMKKVFASLKKKGTMNAYPRRRRKTEKGGPRHGAKQGQKAQI